MIKLYGMPLSPFLRKAKIPALDQRTGRRVCRFEALRGLLELSLREVLPKKFAAIGILVALTACGADSGSIDSGSRNSLAPALQTTEHVDQRTVRLFQRSCALCHVDGSGGAPRIGREEEWQERLAQGDARLLQNTLEGLGDMPPLGYCMACEEQDFVALIHYLSGRTTGGMQ